MITISALLLTTTLLSAVDLSDAQLCNIPTVFQCVDPSSYLQCTPTGVDDTKPPEPCVANPPLTPPPVMGCYGTGPIEDICFVASCQQGAGNYPIIKAPNAYYTCAGPPNNVRYVDATPCPSSYIFDVNDQDCVPATTTTEAVPTTEAVTTTKAAPTTEVVTTTKAAPTTEAVVTTETVVTTAVVTSITTSPAPENPTTPEAPPTGAPTCSGQKLLPDLTSCNHFYVCAGATSGPGKRKQCPFKMRYDVENGKCKIRFLTKCGSRPESS